MISNLIFIESSYSWEITFGLAIIAFALGFIFKSGVLYKQRRRILSLEDEMLGNHSRILSLEKRIAENKIEKPNTHKEFEINHRAEREAKVS
jgi:hypothetical protein